MSTDDRAICNLEAERALLGSCLLDNHAIAPCLEIAGPADFHGKVHREVWFAIKTLRALGKGVDPITLADFLIEAGRYEDLGGDEFVAGLVGAECQPRNAEYYARIVREMAVIRRLADAATAILRDCYSGRRTAGELAAEAMRRIEAVIPRGEATPF